MSQANILVVGDTHVSDRSAFIIPRMVEAILYCIDTYKPDHVVFLGDSLDKFGNDPARRTKQLEDFLYKVTQRVQCTVLIGNHDIENKNSFMSDVHHLNAMKYYWKNITIVDTHCVEFEVNGLTFQAVPYCPVGRLVEGLDTLPGRKPNPAAIFCHQEIRNCNYNGIHSVAGDVWPSTNCLIVCGHIHNTQTISGDVVDGKKNVYIPGSPYQDNFGEDVRTPKTISLMKFTEDSWSAKRISLNLPKKIKLSMTAVEYRTWTPDSNTIHWVTVTGSYSEIATVKYSEKTQLIRQIGGKVTFITTSLPNTEEMLIVKSSKREDLQDIIARAIQDKPELHGIHARIFRK